MGESGTPARNEARMIALVPVLGLLWGFNWPAVRICLDEIAPWTLRATGLLLGGSLLVLLALARGRSLRVKSAHLPRLIFSALLNIGAFNVLLAFAQLGATTSRAAIVTFTMPVWATLLARIFLGERYDGRRIAGLALGIAGLVALGWPLLRAGQLSIGLFFALAGGMCWAAGTVLTKRLPIAAAPLAIAAWQLLIGGVFAATGALLFEGLPILKPLSERTLWALGYHIVMTQALAYFLWFEIVTRIPAGTASLGLLTVPAVGVACATLILGERPTLADGIGLLLVIAAAATVLLPARRREVSTPLAR